MREIKFRAWNKKEKIMDYDQEFIFDYLKPSNFFFKENYERFGDVMQFTGLKDKNRKEIYEGDIIMKSLKDNGRKDEKIIVKWDEQTVGFNISGKKGHMYEIIGDIYQNPELN
jgi:uncharacterized phage protein (TIGR01671 family)